MSRHTATKSVPSDPATLLRRDVNITPAQDDALTREAAALGIGRNELLRRVLDEWRERLTKKDST